METAIRKQDFCIPVSSRQITGSLSMRVHLFKQHPYETTKCGIRVPHLFGSQSHKKEKNVGVYNAKTIHLKDNGIAPDKHYLCSGCFSEKQVAKFMEKEVFRPRAKCQIGDDPVLKMTYQTHRS